MTAYIIVEDGGEWSAARIDTPNLNFNVVGGSIGWLSNVPIHLAATGSTLNHAHQLETLEEAVEHVKKWIARDARKRLGEQRP